MMKHRVAAAVVVSVCAPVWAQLQLAQANKKGTVTLSRDGEPAWTYVTKPPEAAALPVPTAGFFHPIHTPAGEVLTDLSPADHPHHRGVFLAWVEMHGQKDADFWGWGEPAPIKDRAIVHRGVSQQAVGGGAAKLVFRDDWVADGQVMIEQELYTATQWVSGVMVVDLTYTLRPTQDVTLSRWAFSGFCYRGRGEGAFDIYGPGGKSTLPNPNHKKPETNWEDQPWYDGVTTLPGGKVIGMAVLNHPANPATLWHNHRKIRMINPCIVAPAARLLKRGEPLVLRYRLVAHDGPTPTALLDTLARAFAERR